MSYFLPIFFVCLVSQQCDFVYTNPVRDRGECLQELKNKMEYFEVNPAVQSYRVACLELDIKGIPLQVVWE